MLVKLVCVNRDVKRIVCGGLDPKGLACSV